MIGTMTHALEIILKMIYANRVQYKGAFNVGDGYSQSYAGFFHTNYPGLEVIR